MVINIATSTDNNYVDYCGVLFLSILENKSNENICFHLLESDVYPDKLEALKKLVESFEQKIHFYPINKETFEKCPIRFSDHVSKAAYYRLILPELIQDVDKILYLDCDIVVTGSLFPLWNINMENKAIAGILDGKTGDIHIYNRLRYPVAEGYINSGVLVINAKLWREKKYSTMCLQTIADNPDQFKFHDQDCINYMFHDSKILCPIRYNLQDTFLRDECNLMIEYSYFKEIEEARKSPIVIHYSGQVKPWICYCQHPQRALFMEYYKKYTGKDLPIIDTQKRNYIYYLKKIIKFFGLKNLIKKLIQ